MEQKFCNSCEEPVLDKFPACPLQCMSQKCKAYKDTLLVNSAHKPVIWVLGGPGSGRGTQCTKLVQKFGYKHLSSGEILSAEANKENERSMCIRNKLKRGGLVPSDIVLDLIREKIKELEPKATGFLIDGYPRNKNQAVEFEKTVCVPNLIVFLMVTRDTMALRLQNEASQSAPCHSTPEAIQQRITTFYQCSDQILNLYADSGRLVMIDAEKGPDVVFSSLLKVLEPIATNTQNSLKAYEAAAKIPIPLPPVPETAKADMARKEKEKAAKSK